LKFPILDNVGDEALFVLDFHAVKNAAIRIDAHKKRVLGLEGAKPFLG
jgi:hypothetical protein